MFNGIKSCLTHPFCKCPSDLQKWSWSVPSIGGGPGLCLECKTCGMVLNVPNGEFKADLYIENPNPRATAEQRAAAKKDPDEDEDEETEDPVVDKYAVKRIDEEEEVLPDEPTDDHLLALAEYVVRNLMVDVMPADATVRLSKDIGSLSRELVLSEALELKPGTFGGEYSEAQRKYAEACLRALPEFLQDRVELIIPDEEA